MRRLIALTVAVALALPVIIGFGPTPARADNDTATNVALGLAAFAVFNQLLGPSSSRRRARGVSPGAGVSGSPRVSRNPRVPKRARYREGTTCIRTGPARIQEGVPSARAVRAPRRRPSQWRSLGRIPSGRPRATVLPSAAQSVETRLTTAGPGANASGASPAPLRALPRGAAQESTRLASRRPASGTHTQARHHDGELGAPAGGGEQRARPSAAARAPSSTTRRSRAGAELGRARQQIHHAVAVDLAEPHEGRGGERVQRELGGGAGLEAGRAGEDLGPDGERHHHARGAERGTRGIARDEHGGGAAPRAPPRAPRARTASRRSPPRPPPRRRAAPAGAPGARPPRASSSAPSRGPEHGGRARPPSPPGPGAAACRRSAGTRPPRARPGGRSCPRPRRRAGRPARSARRDQLHRSRQRRRGPAHRAHRARRRRGS